MNKPVQKRITANISQDTDTACRVSASMDSTPMVMNRWRRPYVSATWPAMAAPTPTPAMRHVVMSVGMYCRSQTRSHCNRNGMGQNRWLGEWVPDLQMGRTDLSQRSDNRIIVPAIWAKAACPNGKYKEFGKGPYLILRLFIPSLIDQKYNGTLNGRLCLQSDFKTAPVNLVPPLNHLDCWESTTGHSNETKGRQNNCRET